MQQQVLDYAISDKSQMSDWTKISFKGVVESAELSVRATNILLNHVRTIKEFLNLSERDLLHFRNCGKKTLHEILGFRKKLLEELGILETPVKDVEEKAELLKDIIQYNYIFDTIKSLLSKRACNILESYYIDSIERFMALSTSAMKQLDNCHKKTIAEYKKYQDHVFQLLYKIQEYKHSQNWPSEYKLPPSLVYDLFDDIFLQGCEPIDPNAPFSGNGSNQLILYLDILCHSQHHGRIMKQYIQITCPRCHGEDLVKNGHSENGTQRYRCKACRGSFQWNYTYRAWQPGIKEQIETQTLNSSGVRDISRNLKIAKNTVIATLKKKLQPR